MEIILCVRISFLALFMKFTRGRVYQTVYTGSHKIGGGGAIIAPETYPEKNYLRDGDIYVFIIENTEVGGAIQLNSEEFYIQPESWLLIRDSKYGGYASAGSFIGRYDGNQRPPAIIISKSCCLRIEFNEGCCGPAYPGSTGFKFTYTYVNTPGKGRRENCNHEKVFTQFCNGECIPPLNGTCPVKIPDPKDIESKYGKMYPVAIIVATICAFIFIGLIIICVVFLLERHRKWKKKRSESEDDELLLNIIANKIEMKEPVELLLVDSEAAKQCEKFIDRGLFYSRDDSYSSES